MKRLLIFTTLIIVFFAFNSPPALANHSAGGELVYEWISDSTYRFFFIYYRDCAGDPEPSTFPLCFRNSCSSTPFSTTMTKFNSTGTGPGYTCSRFKTRCDSLTSNISGAVKWIYSAVVTLPSRCNSWTIFTYASYRTPDNNLLNSTNTSLYVEATFNNNFQGNSSPYFSIAPPRTVCINQQYYYNCGAVDPNSDSLVTEIVNPLAGVASCSDNPSNAVFATASPSYSIPGNPIPTNNSLSLNAATGNFTFTPAQLGIYALAMRVKEYRGGVFVGSVMREMSIQLYNCFTPTITKAVDTNNITGGTHVKDTILVCPGQAVHFCYDIKSDDTDSHLILTDNHAFSLPAATVSFSTQTKDSVRGCITWTPGISDTGLRLYVATAEDSSCRLSTPVYIYYPLTIPVRIIPYTRIFTDTSICPGGSAILYAIGGGTYSWVILQGGSPSSLSCMNCYNPVATPSVTSQYEVTTTGNASCGYTKDTVTVTVLPFTTPSVSITVSPDSNLTTSSTVTFYTNVANCTNPAYQWKLNGNNVTAGTNSSWILQTPHHGDVVGCTLTCNDPCPQPSTTVSNSITMHITPPNNGVSNLVVSGGLKIIPNPNHGNFTLSLPDLNINGQPVTIEIVNTMGRVIYCEHTMLGKTGEKLINTRGMAPGI